MSETKEFSDILYAYYQPMVERAAKIAHRHAFYMAQDDLENDIWAWLLKDGHKYFVNRDERENRAGNPALSEEAKTSIMIRRAKTLASKELNDYREFCGDYLYQYSEVLRMVKAGFGEGMDDLEERLDFQEAWKLMLRHHPKMARDLVDYYGPRAVRGNGIGNRVGRAVRKLTFYMNNGKHRKRLNLQHI